MPNKIYIIDINNSITLTPSAAAQLTPSTTKLSTSSQYPAVTIVQSAMGQSVGISGYAYGYASVASELGGYDSGSDFFGTNVSQLTIHQIITALNGNVTPVFGAVQINLTTLNSLITNNPTLYSDVTLFTPDIQSAMMTDLAIANIPSDDVTYAKNVLGLPGVSNSLAYYAANFAINPGKVFNHYNSTDLTTMIGSIFSVLATAPIAAQQATIYAIVNGLPLKSGGLSTFRGFNSWTFYPSNMAGTDSIGNYITSITIPGRGNNPGITNNSQDPINAIGFGLSKMGYLTQHSLQSLLSTISVLTDKISGKDLATLNDLYSEAANSLVLLPISTLYTSSPPISNSNVITANLTLQTSYAAYQQNPNNPVLASSLNTAIEDFIDANTIGNNIDDSIDGAFAQLDTAIMPVTSTIASVYNPFPPLSFIQNLTPTAFSSNVSNTGTLGITFNVITTNAGGNVNTIASGSTMPSLITNPTLAMITISGQSSNLITPANVNAIFSFTINT